jgi:hypothetical protein
MSVKMIKVKDLENSYLKVERKK